jgi:hypothetical protein
MISVHAFTEEEIQRYNERSYEVVHNDRAITAIYEGDLEQLDRIFSDFNLAILDADELRILRNMIFARHGYQFSSIELQEWFTQYSWYEPQYDYVNHLLDVVDTININRIKLFESAHKENKEIIVTVGDLIGIWHASPVVAAGYNDLMYFFPDMSFRYSPNQMDWSQRLSAMYGSWEIDHNRLVLYIGTMAVMVGGEIVEPTASCASEFAIEGAQNDAVEFEPPQQWVFPITNIITEEYDPYPQADMDRINIGGFTWWKLSTDPDLELR